MIHQQPADSSMWPSLYAISRWITTDRRFPKDEHWPKLVVIRENHTDVPVDWHPPTCFQCNSIARLYEQPSDMVWQYKRRIASNPQCKADDNVSCHQARSNKCSKRKPAELVCRDNDLIDTPIIPTRSDKHIIKCNGKVVSWTTRSCTRRKRRVCWHVSGPGGQVSWNQNYFANKPDSSQKTSMQRNLKSVKISSKEIFLSFSPRI